MSYNTSAPQLAAATLPRIIIWFFFPLSQGRSFNRPHNSHSDISFFQFSLVLMTFSFPSELAQLFHFFLPFRPFIFPSSFFLRRHTELRGSSFSGHQDITRYEQEINTRRVSSASRSSRPAPSAIPISFQLYLARFSDSCSLNLFISQAVQQGDSSH